MDSLPFRTFSGGTILTVPVRTFSGVVVEDTPASGERVLSPVNLEPAVEHPQPDGMPELIYGAQVINVQIHL